MNKIVINHAGYTGDLVYCLPMLTELKEVIGCRFVDFHIQTNVKSNLIFSHPNGDVRMTEKASQFLLPLLQHLSLFEKITIGDEAPKCEVDERMIDLSAAYNLSINYMAGNIEEWPYNLIRVHLPQDFSRQIIKVKKNEVLKDKVILLKSSRYNNEALDLSILKRHSDKLVFIGLENEHKEFEERYFKIDYHKINDALEFAETANGAKGVISNQNGLYSIVELMKTPRILLSPEFIKMNGRTSYGPVNNQPQGGWFEVAATQAKFEVAIENLNRYAFG